MKSNKMKCIIFCGGFGTRMNNGEPGRLKPLIEVAGKEILRHIISIYESQKVVNFILLGGYKIDELIQFANKYSNDKLNIKVLDTGIGTPTGGRLFHAKNLIKEDFFLLTYGDSLTNFNLEKCFNLMDKKNANMSISTFQKKIEYGILDIDENSILKKIYEKTFTVPINAGFYVLNNKVFDYIKTINESFEIDILPRIILDKSNTIVVNDLNFWHPMDTPEDREKLNDILLNNPNKLIEN
jgi:glucose-1-phosphate cytidylyltransferase